MECENVERTIRQKNLNDLMKTCVENHETLETEFSKKSQECERLKSSLEDAREKFSTPDEFPIDSEWENLIEGYETPFQGNLGEESLDCDSRRTERLKLKLKKKKEQCRRLKIELQNANEELTKTNELLCDGDGGEKKKFELKLKKKKEQCRYLKSKLKFAKEELTNTHEELTKANELLCESGGQEKLKLKLKKKKEQCRRLKTELQTANAELTKANELSCDRQEKEKLELELKKKTEECEILKTESETAKEELTRINELLCNGIKKKERLELELNKKTKQCEILKTESETAKGELTRINELLCNSIRKTERLEFELNKKAEQCKSLKTSLGTAHEELTKTNELLNAEKMRSSKIDTANELPCDNQEKERLELELNKKIEQCESLKAELETAHEEFTRTKELLNAEKLLRSKVEFEQNSLTCVANKLRRLLIVFLEYQHCLSPHDKTVVFNALNDAELMTKLKEHESDTDCFSSKKDIVNDQKANGIANSSVMSSFSTENRDDSNQKMILSSINEALSSQSRSFPETYSEPIIEHASSSETFPMITCITSQSSVQSLEYIELTTVVATEVSLSQTETCEQRTSISDAGESEEKATLSNDNLPKEPEVRSPTVSNYSPLDKDDSSINKKELSHSLLFPKISIEKQSLFTCDFCGEFFVKETCLKKHQQKHTSSQSSVENKKNVQSTSTKETGNSTSSTMILRKRTFNAVPVQSQKKATLLNGSSPKKRKVRSVNVSNESLSSKKDSNLAVQCDICSQSFSTNNTLNRHKRGVHDRIKPHKCSECDKTFFAKSELREHLARHNQNFKSNFDRMKNQDAELHRAKTHKCSECNKTFFRKYYLRRHQLVHTSERPFRCSICYRSFKTKSTRTMHVKVVHGDYGVYCAYCNKKYAKKHNLIIHITTHHLRSNQHHRCSICEKSFKSDYIRSRHEKRTHTDDPSSCGYCEKLFRSKDLLKKHIIRMHSAELCV